MALAWALRDPRITSALIGASSVAQLEDNVAALDTLEFTDEELAEIERYAMRVVSTSGRPRRPSEAPASRSRTPLE